MTATQRLVLGRVAGGTVAYAKLAAMLEITAELSRSKLGVASSLQKAYRERKPHGRLGDLDVGLPSFYLMAPLPRLNPLVIARCRLCRRSRCLRSPNLIRSAASGILRHEQLAKSVRVDYRP